MNTPFEPPVQNAAIKRGVFVGLCTLDILYDLTHLPGPDEKIEANRQLVLAGGPACNAAATFAHLSRQKTWLLTALGTHPTCALQRADVEPLGVEFCDLSPGESFPPAISSILIPATTGQRSVVSTNARQAPALVWTTRAQNALDSASFVLIDGHHREAARRAVRSASERGVPVVLDGGSWKEGTETLMPRVTYAICAERFAPPGCQTHRDVAAWCLGRGANAVAITRGPRPILYSETPGDLRSLPVPSVSAVDTLGCGDIFHGAFCFFRFHGGDNFVDALQKAATIASLAATTLGTRAWMSHDAPLKKP